MLTGEVEARLKERIEQTCFEIKVDIIEMEIMPGHDLRKEFKSLTTRLPTLWTNSYFVSTGGGAPLSVIKQYIENQKNSQRR